MVTAFQLVGDMSHLAAIVLLPFKLHSSGSAAGVSLKTQELYLLVFLARYLDIYVHFVSWYNSSMKLIFISVTAVTIAMFWCRPPLKASYDKSMDSFRHWMYLAAPSFALAMAIYVWNFGAQMNSFFVFRTFWWTFSELLEPVAIVPQLLVLRRFRDAGKLIWCYVSLMAVYRALYILIWVWAATSSPWYIEHHVLYYTAMSQTAIYVVFFMDHITREPHSPPDDDGTAELTSSVRERLLQGRLSFSSDGSSPARGSRHPSDLEAPLVKPAKKQTARPRSQSPSPRPRRALSEPSSDTVNSWREGGSPRDRAMAGTYVV